MKMTSGSVVWADKLGDFNQSELRYLSDHPIFFALFPNKFKNNCIEISARFGGGAAVLAIALVCAETLCFLISAVTASNISRVSTVISSATGQ